MPENETLYQAIFDNVILAHLLIAPDGQIVSANPAAERLFGFQNGELVGKPLHLILPELQLERSQVSIGMDATARRKNGSSFPARLDLNRFQWQEQALHVAVVRDNSANVEMEKMQNESLVEALDDLETQREQVAHRNSEIDAIINTSTEAIILVSPQGVFRKIDRQFVNFFGIEESEIKNRSWSELVPLVTRIFENPDDVLSLLGNSAPDKETIIRTELVQQWPQHRELYLISSPVFTSSLEHIGRLYAFRDVTYERELDRMKDQFVSMVSHELRTPLTSIRGFTEMILDEDAGAINEEQEEFLKIVLSNSDRLIALVNDLLDMSRIESGRIELKRKQISAADLLDPVARTMQQLIEEKEQTLTIVIEPGLPSLIVDRDRIVQVLTNLISNAHKYTPIGGAIGIEATGEGNMARIAITDNGFGISEKDQEQLFTRFFRVSNSLTREIGGTGLGLNIVKSLVELHGGEVNIISKLGSGSTFSFTVPVSGLDTADKDDLEIGQAIGIGAVSTAHHRILVVEDDPDISRLICQNLRNGGYTVEAAFSAEEALRVLQGDQPLPHLITLDIKLPGMNGFELAEKLGQDARTADIPIQVISIYSDDPRGAQIGLERGLPKPINRGQLLEAVHERLAEVEHNQSVLIISADIESRDLLRQALQASFEILVAPDGEAGLALSHDEHPGLILLDLRLPEMDSISVLHELKQNPKTAIIPVIGLSSVEGFQLSERARVLASGAADILTKPLDLDLLVEEVRLLIQDLEDE